MLPKGVGPSTFDDTVYNLQPSDVPAVRPARNGDPITLDKIKAQGIWGTIGNGVYKIKMKDPDSRVPVDLIMENGKPLIINMNPMFARNPSYQPVTGVR